MAQGQDPLGVRSPERQWPYYYPPTLAVAVLPLTPLPLPVAAGLWYALGAAGLALGVVAARQAAGRPERWELVDYAAAGLIALPAASGLLRGQVGTLLLACCGLGLRDLARDEELRAGAWLGLAAALKPTPGLLLLGCLVGGRWRATAAGLLVVGLGWFVVPAPFLGLAGAAGSTVGFFENVALGSAEDPTVIVLPDGSRMEPHIATNQSLSSQWVRHTSGELQRRGPLVLGLLVLVACLLLCRTREDRPGFAALALLLALPLIASPIAWHHHHVLLFPALLVVGRALPQVRWPVLGTFALLSLLHFAVKPLRPFGLLGWGTLLVMVAVAAQGAAADRGGNRTHGRP